jgi:cephalosporin hydroxylase
MPDPVPGSWLRPRGWQRIFLRPLVRRTLSANFARLYYAHVEWTVFETKWLGRQTLKYPTDLWIYQEIVSATLPDVIIETGTWHGGSALYLANVCDALDHGRVLSIDIAPQEPLPEHPRITFLEGSSVAPEILDRVRAELDGAERVMVILDSDHSRDHVLAELQAYAGIVTPGCYLIAEDTNVNGHPVLPEHGSGPGEAVAAFLDRDDHYRVDRARERLLLTANPGGYLLRVR